MSENKFLSDLNIDLDNLHEEFKNHAHLRWQYAQKLTTLEHKLRKTEEKVKVERSLLRIEAFRDPEETCSKKKITDKDVEAYYRISERHQSAKSKMFEVKKELSMVWNAVKAMDDRKSAIEGEIKLYLNNYFSTPRTERSIEGAKDFREEMKERQNEKMEEIQDKQRESLKTRRRRRS